MGTYRDTPPIDDTNIPGVKVGVRSYYAGHYHGGSFEDCILYLDKADAKKDVDRLTIGSYCSIASGVKFMLGGNQGHRHDWIATYPLDIIEPTKRRERKTPKAFLKKGNTVIGSDVWIGYEALIMPGVKIGDGAVIAARAVVTKDVEPYAIVGGNPAKLIKYRFEKEDRETLLEVQWWSWPEEKILQHTEELRGGDVQKLLGDL
jgi:chloramphenicol O-acetyltransferase type B